MLFGSKIVPLQVEHTALEQLACIFQYVLIGARSAAVIERPWMIEERSMMNVLPLLIYCQCFGGEFFAQRNHVVVNSGASFNAEKHQIKQ